MCEFEVDFKKPFYCGFNLSNGDIISVLFEHVMLRFVTASRSENGYRSYRQGLKTGGRKGYFLVRNRVRI